jgi:signal transduction histidine kinase
VQAEVGLRNALRWVFETSLQIFGSNRTLLVVREKSTERVFIWESSRVSSLSQPSLGWTEADEQGRTGFNFVTPGSTWLIRKMKRRSGNDEVAVEVLDEDRTGFRRVQWSPPAALLDKYPFRSALGVNVDAGTEWTGSWWILDPDFGTQPRVAASFLHLLSRQLFPSVHAIFVMRRLRSQAGAMERARVARELHDGVIQSMIGLEMQVDVLRRKPGVSPEHLSAELTRIQSLMHEEVLNLRELMQQMKPLEYNPKQFLDLLAEMVEKFRRDTGIGANFVSSLREVELASRVGNEVARILQEALVNIRKHSGARNVLVRFDAQDGLWKLAVDDDGCGFDFSGRLSQAELDRARKGPVIIKERTRSIGGEITIESVSGRGARLEVLFPQRRNG